MRKLIIVSVRINGVIKQYADKSVEICKDLPSAAIQAHILKLAK